jgi:hypothetical protein
MKNSIYYTFLFVFFCSTLFSQAGEGSPTGPDPALVQDAIRQGVAFLQSQPPPPQGDKQQDEATDEEEEEEEVFFDPPARSRKKVGVKEVTVRYRIVEVEIPVYEYSTKEVLVRRSESSETEAGMVKKTVQVRGKQIGTKTVQRQKSDPNGPLTRTAKHTLWDRTGPDYWKIGQIASNCMAGLVMMRTRDEGEALPERVEGMLNAMKERVETFGAPEITYDLAWLIVAFSESGEDTYQEMVPDLVARLIKAQLREGPGKGLWGAVAVDPEELAIWMGKTAQMTEKVDEMNKSYEESGSRTEMKKLMDSRKSLAEANEQLKRFAGSYLEPNPANNVTNVTTEQDEAISWASPDEYIFNQRTADLENTWIALYALRIARENRLLPGSVEREKLMPGRQGMVGTESISVVASLHAAGQAVMSRQHPSGAFPEMNIQQPVTAFDDIEGLPGVPIDKRSFQELDQPITLTSTAQGLAALDQLRHILGMQAMRPYANSMIKAKKLLDATINEVGKGDLEKVGENGLSLFAFYLALCDSGPDLPVAPTNLTAIAADHLLELQENNGNWKKPFQKNIWVPTVWHVRSLSLPQIPMKRVSEKTSKPFVRLKPTREDTQKNDYRYWRAYNPVTPVMGTAAALLVLDHYEKSLRSEMNKDSDM